MAGTLGNKSVINFSMKRVVHIPKYPPILKEIRPKAYSVISRMIINYTKNMCTNLFGGMPGSQRAQTPDQTKNG